jgi:ferredoxin
MLIGVGGESFRAPETTFKDWRSWWAKFWELCFLPASCQFCACIPILDLPASHVGETILQLAHRIQSDDWNLEGACEGVAACSTCHVILEENIYDDLPEPSEEEEDMLDMAFGLTTTSRLGCQVEISEEMANTKITLPAATRNFYVDGHTPKPH